MSKWWEDINTGLKRGPPYDDPVYNWLKQQSYEKGEQMDNEYTVTVRFLDDGTILAQGGSRLARKTILKALSEAGYRTERRAERYGGRRMSPRRQQSERRSFKIRRLKP